MVLVEHVAQSLFGSAISFGPGPAGVTVFFVLSGYLITSLLQREERIDLRNFYLRRVVRLGPALLLLIAFVAVVGIVEQTNWIPGVAAALFYSTNLFLTSLHAPLVSQTWSLAIEEQFYLLWPLVMIVIPRRYLILVALIGAAAGCAIYSGDTYYSTLANGGAILAGCALAISGLSVPRAVGVLGLGLILVDVLFWAHGLTVIGSVLVIAGSIKALVPLGALGRRAYSLYLWNTPMFILLGPSGIVATIIIGELSYRLIERPLVRRLRFPPRVSSAYFGTGVPRWTVNPPSAVTVTVPVAVAPSETRVTV